MTDKILIENYEVKTCHGVNPEEKVEPQRFLISCELYCDFSEAVQNDDIDKTTSYASVCKLIKAFFCDNCFNLLETLAYGTAERILLAFPLISRADVTVRKPDAPMKGVFDSVGVFVSLLKHEVYLALGSSLGDKEGYLDFAVQQLSEDKKVLSVTESPRLLTEPYGGAAEERFLNSAVRIETVYSPHQLLNRIHEIEQGGERVRTVRWGDRTLDIDILFYDDTVTDDVDLVIPHTDMQNRVFVLEPLSHLCPNKMHPVLQRRVCDMLSDLTLQKK